MLPDILSDVERCVYLDSDTMVCGDIGKLLDYDVTDYYLAAVKDCDITKVYYKRFYWTRGVKKYLRRQSNKAIRNATFDELPTRGCGYKKKYDLWWELY